MTQIKKYGSTLFVVVIVLVIIAFGIYCVYQLRSIAIEKNCSDEVIDDLRIQFYDDRVSQEQLPDDKVKLSSELPTEDLLSRYARMKDINSEYVAWLKINDTNVDYPVVQENVNDIGYYLKHNFRKKWSSYGTPYLSASCNINSGNLVIQAHNMRDGSMFGCLSKYRKSDWAMNHRIIELYTDSEHRYYEVIAVITQDADFPVVNWAEYIDFQSSEQSYRYALETVNHSIIDFGYQPVESTEIIENYITLSTCEYSHSNGRLLIIAKRIQ